MDRPPTGFRRDLIVEHDGEHRGTLDIKKGGLLPIVDLARSAALAAGVAAASTAARLDAVEAAGTIAPSDVTVLRDAFDLVTELRMQHQVQQLRRGQAPDNHMDPDAPTPLVRTYLRDAFRAVDRVQRGIKTSIQYGALARRRRTASAGRRVTGGMWIAERSSASGVAEAKVRSPAIHPG